MSVSLIRASATAPPLADVSVDSVVTDPPAGIAFMWKEWDSFGGRANARAAEDRDAAYDRYGKGALPYAFSGSAMPKRGDRERFVSFLSEALSEAYRVAKPGSRLLCWAIPRTSHWTGTAIEDAGWVIEDRIAHLFGQGFPKAKSRLKPACEDWWLARKPSRTVPALAGLDACRLSGDGLHPVTQGLSDQPEGQRIYGGGDGFRKERRTYQVPSGRWPANVTLDEEAAAALDEMAPTDGHGGWPDRRGVGGIGTNGHGGQTDLGRRDECGIGASRFFYVAKSDRAERNAGCSDIAEQRGGAEQFDSRWKEGTGDARMPMCRNHHPTVKPIALMRWLCRLITPLGGTVLDCFCGSGSTGVAAVEEGFSFIGIEREPDYLRIAAARLKHATRQPLLWSA